MQSGGYGGVSEFQQFIMDGAFPLSAPPPQQQPPPPAVAQEPFRYQPLHHHALQPQHHHHHAPPPMPPHFAHFAAAGGGGIPFTQQLLHQAAAAAGHHPHLQLFQEQQHHHHHHKPQPPPPTRWAPHHHQHHHHLGFDVEAAAPESSGPAGGSTASGAGATPGIPPFLAAAMSFKLGVDAGGGSGATTGGTDGGGGSGMMLHVGGDDEAATESRLRRWPGDEETSIKEPTWRPLDIDYLHSTSSSSKKEKAATPESAPAANYLNKQGADDIDNAASAAAGAGAGAAPAPGPAGGGGGGNYKLFSELEAIYKPGSSGGCGAQTGSGSGLTGDDNATILEQPPADLPKPNVSNNNNTSEGEDVAAVVQPQQQQQQQQQEKQPHPSQSERKRKRRKQATAEQVSASASFFERLVRRLMEHQESLHRQFLDAMERRERERAARDEAWRRQEADKLAREAAARAQDRASAAAREAAIIAYLEKLSGESITLPPREAHQEEATAMTVATNKEKEKTMLSCSSSSRWPKHEVEALIRVRTGLEGRFQEPGLKGPLWEEVSARMAAAGYGRSAKRCKEKWENINKYFRKAKESGKKRPSQAKTCPYFDELDRLYSRSSSSMNSSELLDAVVKYPEGPPGFIQDDDAIPLPTNKQGDDDHHDTKDEAAIARGNNDPEEEDQREDDDQDAQQQEHEEEEEDHHH